MPPETAPSTFLDLILYPHRSLPLRGFWIMIAGVAGLSAMIGAWFVSRGAWPVTGFFGLDVLLLAWFFRRNYRDGRMFEQVRLTARELTVDRVNPAGQAQRWSFEPTWLRVELTPQEPVGNRLTLASHGRALTIGSFLPPEERVDVAEEIRGALVRRRRAISP